MKHHSSDPRASRRDLLARGVRLAVLAVATSVVPDRAKAADKLPKSAVQYDETRRIPGQDCDDCTQFIPGSGPSARGTCLVVAGDVSPHGHCVAFTPKAKG